MPVACPQANEWKHLSSQGSRAAVRETSSRPVIETPHLAGCWHVHSTWESMHWAAFLGAVDGKSQLLGALRTRRIDAVARGIAGNTDAVQASSGAFVVMAAEDVAEQGGSSVTVEDATVAMCPNEMIDCLTRGRCFGYRDRRHDPWVFRQRALL